MKKHLYQSVTPTTYHTFRKMPQDLRLCLLLNCQAFIAMTDLVVLRHSVCLSPFYIIALQTLQGKREYCNVFNNSPTAITS